MPKFTIDVCWVGDRVCDFECSAGKVVPFTPTSVVYHTNHPLANDDYDAEYADSLKNIDPARVVKGNSEIRFQALENRFHCCL